MSDRTYTLKEMVALLSQRGSEEESSRIARQIRHWTLSDLLRPAGRKFTGKGISRQYPLLEVQKAALLRELSRYGMTVTHLEGIDAWFKSISKMDEWQRALDGSKSVFIVLMWNIDDDELAVRTVTADPPDLPWEYSADPKPPPALFDEYDDYVSAVVVSLNKVLEKVTR